MGIIGSFIHFSNLSRFRFLPGFQFFDDSRLIFRNPDHSWHLSHPGLAQGLFDTLLDGKALSALILAGFIGLAVHPLAGLLAAPCWLAGVAPGIGDYLGAPAAHAADVFQLFHDEYFFKLSKTKIIKLYIKIIFFTTKCKKKHYQIKCNL